MSHYPIIPYYSYLENQLWTSTTTSVKIGTLKDSTVISLIWSNYEEKKDGFGI
jgi:hypothetical protein